MTVALGALAVLLASFLGGVVGFAYGLVSFPLLLLAGVPLDQVVAANLIVALCTRLLILAKRHRDVCWPRVWALVGGSLPGMLLGLYALSFVDARLIQMGAGALIIIVVVVLVVRQRSTSRGVARERRSVEMVAGSFGGFLGVTTSMNGVPPAIMLTGSRVKARSIVADMAVFFIIGNLLTLVALGLGDRLPLIDILPLVAVWIPVGLLGSYTGLAVGPRLPQEAFRKLALSLIFVAGVLCIAGAL